MVKQYFNLKYIWFFKSCLNRLLFEVYIVINIYILEYYLVFSNILTNINYSINFYVNIKEINKLLKLSIYIKFKKQMY